MSADPRHDLVNLLARRSLIVDYCMMCGDEVMMTERAYIQLRQAHNCGACVIFYCDSCMAEYQRLHQPAAPRSVHKALPLP